MLVLAGDLGGTHCRLRLARCGPGGCETLHQAAYRNDDWPDAVSLIQAFLKETGEAGLPRPEYACLGAAGPVHGAGPREEVALTNRPWRLDTADLVTATGIPRWHLVNDFEAAAWGIGELGAEDLAVLQRGTPVTGAARAVLGAGTGLGMAVICPDGRPLPGEGGHAAFAPRDARQWALAAWLAARGGSVSRENLVSGPGLLRIAEFLALPRPCPWDDPPGVSAAAEAGDPLAEQALALFCRLYGQIAADLALTAGARGGLYVAGGIAPQILDALRANFMEGFLDLKPYRDWLREIPVAVVTAPDLGLRGALHAALASASPPRPEQG